MNAMEHDLERAWRPAVNHFSDMETGPELTCSRLADGQPRRRYFRRHRPESGAALVEFALIAPILFMLIFGIIEFGWTFYQLNDVRHAARETARLAAVNYKTSDVSGATQTQQIIDEACERMEEGNIEILLTLNGTAVGDSVHATVKRKYDSLTGFFEGVYNPDSIDSTVEIRLEQPATFASEPEDSDPNKFKDCP